MHWNLETFQCLSCTVTQTKNVSVDKTVFSRFQRANLKKNEHLPQVAGTFPWYLPLQTPRNVLHTTHEHEYFQSMARFDVGRAQADMSILSQTIFHFGGIHLWPHSPSAAVSEILGWLAENHLTPVTKMVSSHEVKFVLPNICTLTIWQTFENQ